MCTKMTHKKTRNFWVLGLLAALSLAIVRPVDAQDRQIKLGNSGWTLFEDNSEATGPTCNVMKETEGSLFKFGIGSQGSFIIALADMTLINQLDSVGLWKPNANYQAQVYIGKSAPISTSAQQYGGHTVIVKLPYHALPLLSKSSAVAVNLNGLAMRGYKVSNIDKALTALIACGKRNSLIAP